MSRVQKNPESLFSPKERITNFEHVEVNTSHLHAMMIQSRTRMQQLARLLACIDQRREAMHTRRGLLDDSCDG